MRTLLGPLGLAFLMNPCFATVDSIDLDAIDADPASAAVPARVSRRTSRAKSKSTPNAAPAPTPAPVESPPLPITTTTAPADDYARWFVIVPAFVIHGLDPSGGANLAMPRRIFPDGRAVATPGVGLEYQGRSSFEAAVAFVKDCYDNPAGALQVGQHFRLNHAWDIGYSVGVYMRQTPIACFTQTIVETVNGSSLPGTINLGGGRRGTPVRTNTLTTTSCAFEDNLPLRYTTRLGSGYMDIIPTPFLHASTRLLRDPWPIWLKVISNFYLSEFGLEVAF